MKNLKTIKNFGIIDILIIMALIISNLMIGTPLRYNIEIPSLIINILAIIYFFIFIRKKRKIELNRFDVFVILLSLTTLIPLIFGSYLRFRYTLEYIIRYMSALNMYLIIKEYSKQGKINIIVNCILIMSVVTILFGIDMMTNKTLGFFYEFIKVPVISNESKDRILSLFKYPNAYCIYIGIALFLTLSAYIGHNKEEQKKDKVKNILYTNVIFMQLFGIIMTFSRLGWIIIFGLLVLYIILLKENWKNIVTVLICSGANAVIYFCLYNKALNTGNVLVIWGLLVLQNIVQFILFFNMNYIKNILRKTNKKSWGAIAFIIIIIFVACYSRLPNELTLFNSSSSQKQYKRTNIFVEGNKEYKFKIDLTAETNRKSNFKIYINEFNDMEKRIFSNRSIIEKNVDGEIEIDIKTKEETKFLSLIFMCSEPGEDTKMVVHSVKMNDKEIKVYDKLIPIKLITRLEMIKSESASVNIRFEYIKQSIRIIRENPIWGFGGYAWLYFQVENVDLQSVAEHCYPLQLFMQNGIVAFWIYIYIILMAVEKFIKMVKNKKIDITMVGFFMSLFLMILHSLFDFDMYFNIMLIDMYICFAIINRDETKVVKGQKILYCLYGVILVILLYFCIGETINVRFDINKIEESKRMDVVNTRLVLFPYDYQYYEEKILLLYDMKEKGENLENGDIDEEISRCIDFLERIEKIQVNEE